MSNKGDKLRLRGGNNDKMEGRNISCCQVTKIAWQKNANTRSTTIRCTVGFMQYIKAMTKHVLKRDCLHVPAEDTKQKLVSCRIIYPALNTFHSTYPSPFIMKLRRKARSHGYQPGKITLDRTCFYLPCLPRFTERTGEMSVVNEKCKT